MIVFKDERHIAGGKISNTEKIFNDIRFLGVETPLAVYGFLIVPGEPRKFPVNRKVFCDISGKIHTVTGGSTLPGEKKQVYIGVPEKAVKFGGKIDVVRFTKLVVYGFRDRQDYRCEGQRF